MPSSGSSMPINWQRWYACRDVIAKQMAAEGWNKYARKFREIHQRRANKLYLKGKTQ